MPGHRNPETAGREDAAAASDGCGCGAHAGTAEHDAVMLAQWAADTATRRAFLAIVGAGVALRALGDIFSLDAARAFARETPGQLEEQKIGRAPPAGYDPPRPPVGRPAVIDGRVIDGGAAATPHAAVAATQQRRRKS